MHPKGAELNLYNSRDFTNQIHLQLTQRSSEDAQEKKTLQPAGLLIAMRRRGRRSFPVLTPEEEEASFLHHPRSPEILPKPHSSLLHLSAWGAGLLPPGAAKIHTVKTEADLESNTIPLCKRASSSSSPLAPKFVFSAHRKFQR